MTSQTAQENILNQALHDDLISRANSKLNPPLKAISYVDENSMQSGPGCLNEQAMKDKIMQYARNHQELILETETVAGRPCVVLVTPFMQRAHKELRDAGEVVFVDATSCVDHSTSVVIPILCAGPAGAVPLAVIFSSSNDEATLTKG